MMFYGQDDLDSVRRLVWGRLFGQCVEKTRQAAGRSVAEAAHLAGMEASEWSAVEAGFVPDPAKLRPMADALALRYDRIATHGCSLPGCLGAVNPACRRPGPAGALAAGTHNPICSPPEKGGESDQDEGRNRVKTLERQYLRRASPQLQVRDSSTGLRDDRRASGVHPEVCSQEWARRSKEKQARMKRAALYLRVSTVDQHPETQLLDLRQMAAQRGYEIVQEYTDRSSGVKARRPGLDQMMADARRGRFDVVLVWASDRIARSVKHFLDVLDELNRIGVEFVSFREQIDTGGPLGRAIIIIVGAVAELERNLIVERVRAGMRRARLDGQRIGRAPLVLDSAAIQQDRQRGQSIRQIAKGHSVSTATIQRVLRKTA